MVRRRRASRATRLGVREARPSPEKVHNHANYDDDIADESGEREREVRTALTLRFIRPDWAARRRPTDMALDPAGDPIATMPSRHVRPASGSTRESHVARAACLDLGLACSEHRWMRGSMQRLAGSSLPLSFREIHLPLYPHIDSLRDISVHRKMYNLWYSVESLLGISRTIATLPYKVWRCRFLRPFLRMVLAELDAPDACRLPGTFQVTPLYLLHLIGCSPVTQVLRYLDLSQP